MEIAWYTRVDPAFTALGRHTAVIAGAEVLAGGRNLGADELRDKFRCGYVTFVMRSTRLRTGGHRVGSLEVIESPGHTP